MSEEAAGKLSEGLMWFGFWLMIGLANFGEPPSNCSSVANDIYERIINRVDK